tara:strand:- start:344 stop:463 length:120 start_codon:yes stop_codon:yes gene_type:complete
MVTEIDINIGRRTVLRYLLHPVFQSLDVALSPGDRQLEK